MSTCFTINRVDDRYNTTGGFNTDLVLDGEQGSIESSFRVFVINSLNNAPNYLIESIDFTDALLKDLNADNTNTIGINRCRRLANKAVEDKIGMFGDLEELIFYTAEHRQYRIEHKGILNYCIVLEIEVNGKGLQLIKNSKEFFNLGSNRKAFMKPLDPNISYGKQTDLEIAKHCI